jgi:hypothetical protein
MLTNPYDDYYDVSIAEQDACNVLYSGGFEHRAGIWYHPFKKSPNQNEWYAIDYLCQEWDYGYERC